MHEETYWQAVLNRDSRSDGAFVYAVRSTGIYCNPSCPSRRPQREQVIFFPVPEAAEQAGFRACRRCRPRESTIYELQVELVQRACRYIEENLEDKPTLADLSTHVGMSPYHLQRIFKRIMGITPRQYAEASRLGQLKTKLKEGESVTMALYNAGYSSSSRLYERAPTQLGMTPTTYRRGGQGMHISYTIVDCPLLLQYPTSGSTKRAVPDPSAPEEVYMNIPKRSNDFAPGRLLVAATEKGVCAVSLGDSDADLEAALQSEYPAAEIHRDSVDLSQWVNAILKHLNGQQPHLNLPLDVQATAFQWRVWQELRTIPYGSTRSYSEVAQALGSPKAARAVAQACATNPVALVVPCHRVVREDGSLGGYRWGTDRKQHLLAQEAIGADNHSEPS
jgi:AraC family transcriptional regulator of adaptative response/methylated-DNA-[protein]-cysteine methyltransferase